MILKVRDRFSPQVQIGQRQLILHYQECLRNKQLPELKDTGFRVFSQFEEDGLLLFLFSVLGTTNQVFVEIGSDDGINSNCANLAMNFGWTGLFIDGNKKAIERGRKFYNKYPHPWGPKPEFINAMILRENVNELIRNAGIEGEIDLLSVDIDGNDYWIWDALEVVSPRVVIIETHVEFGMNNIVVPYDKDYVYPGKHPDYHGASPIAMARLAKRKGYCLVGANRLGFNMIFVKEELGKDIIPKVTVESVLTDPSTIESFKRFDAISDWEYVTIDE